MDMEFLQNVVNGNTERFQGQNGGLPQPAPTGTYMTPGAYRRARQSLIAVIFMPIMWRIGRNWYQRTGDGSVALGKAAVVVWYWKAWFFACFAWFMLEMAGGFWGQQLKAGAADIRDLGTWHAYCRLVWLVGLPPLFVVYTRLVDMSLFKHRLVYRIVHPVDKVLHWLPWPVLLSMVLIPLFFVIQVGAHKAEELTPTGVAPTTLPGGVYDPSSGAVYPANLTGVVYDPSTGALLSENR